MKAKNGTDAAVSLPAEPSAASRASWVEKTPGVCGGDACIRRTRITVWGLVERQQFGLSDAEILDRLPNLAQADLEAAWEYYKQNRGEIDQAIKNNAEA